MKSKLVIFCNVLVGYLVRTFFKVRKDRVLFWADAFEGYGCNPRAISDYIIEERKPYKVYWAFREPQKYDNIDKRIKVVRQNSLLFVYLVNTSQFLITNHRTYPLYLGWKKRANQKYIMTWHGTMGVKKVELELSRSQRESEISKIDSNNCDIMISDSQWFDNIIRTALGYQGQILKVGMPRNDIYFNARLREKANQNVRDCYKLSDSIKIVLYAPTFRKDYSTSSYFDDWSSVLPQLNKFLGGEVAILVRYHPILKRSGIHATDKDGYGIDVTEYDNMQELLCAADLLITDYSSTMFDMGLMNKPCILYASDINDYDRNYNFDLSNLPMPLVRNGEEFQMVLDTFSYDKYLKDVSKFYSDVFKVYEGHNGCETFCNWMQQQNIK